MHQRVRPRDEEGPPEALGAEGRRQDHAGADTCRYQTPSHQSAVSPARGGPLPLCGSQGRAVTCDLSTTRPSVAWELPWFLPLLHLPVTLRTPDIFPESSL